MNLKYTQVMKRPALLQRLTGLNVKEFESLDAALGQSHVRPKRAKGRSLEEIIEEFPELKELGILTDGTERPIRRPKDDIEQKEHYSGKKKRHTSKHVTITHPKTQRILAV